MLNSKQRAKLRSVASTIEATTIIGKDGLTEIILSQIDKQLFAHEIVKISVLETSEQTAEECLIKAADELHAEQVCSIGHKFVLYRKSNKKGIKHIALD